MCKTCWKEAGSPSIVNDLTKSVAEMIDKVYEWHGSGGNLHTVIDDDNLEDSSIDFCLKEIKKNWLIGKKQESKPTSKTKIEKLDRNDSLYEVKYKINELVDWINAQD